MLPYQQPVSRRRAGGGNRAKECLQTPAKPNIAHSPVAHRATLTKDPTLARRRAGGGRAREDRARDGYRHIRKRVGGGEGKEGVRRRLIGMEREAADRDSAS